jgi:hypothetical protein
MQQKKKQYNTAEYRKNKYVQLYLPPPIKKAFEEMAEKNGRSLSREISFALEKLVEKMVGADGKKIKV